MVCFLCGKIILYFIGSSPSQNKYEDSFGDELYICEKCESKNLNGSTCENCKEKILLPYNKSSNRFVITYYDEKILKICKCKKLSFNNY